MSKNFDYLIFECNVSSIIGFGYTIAVTIFSDAAIF